MPPPGGPRARGPGLRLRGNGGGRSVRAAPARRGAPRSGGRVSVSRSSPLGEDPSDHDGIGDHGDDPHPPRAPGAGERVHLEDPAEQLGPAAPRGAEGPVDRVDDRHRCLGRGFGLAPPLAPGAAGVPAVVALHHLTRVGDGQIRRASSTRTSYFRSGVTTIVADPTKVPFFAVTACGWVDVPPVAGTLMVSG